MTWIVLLWLQVAFLVPSPGDAVVQNCPSNQSEEMAQSIRQGDLSGARILALDALMLGCDEDSLRNRYKQEVDNFLETKDDAFQQIQQALQERSTLTQSSHYHDAPDCWNVDDYQEATKFWDSCCAQVPPDNSHDPSKCLRDAGRHLCCHFRQGTASYLRLPALRELGLTLQLVTEDGETVALRLEQDGFLCVYNVAGVLWPSAYLLSLCVAAPVNCGIPELHHNLYQINGPITVLELGAGIGAPAIALANSSQNISVVATDKSRHALALTLANAYAASVKVEVELLDHYNQTQLDAFSRHHAPGFSIILGSALQQLYLDKDTLWDVLNVLLLNNTDAVVILTHSILGLPNLDRKRFHRIRTISGIQFGMRRMFDESSDFEISVFHRVMPILDDEL